MFFSIDPAGDVPIYEQIVRQVRERAPQVSLIAVTESGGELALERIKGGWSVEGDRVLVRPDDGDPREVPFQRQGGFLPWREARFLPCPISLLSFRCASGLSSRDLPRRLSGGLSWCLSACGRLYIRW